MASEDIHIGLTDEDWEAIGEKKPAAKSKSKLEATTSKEDRSNKLYTLLDEAVQGPSISDEELQAVLTFVRDRMNKGDDYAMVASIKLQSGAVIQIMGGGIYTCSLLVDTINLLHEDRVRAGRGDKPEDADQGEAVSWDELLGKMGN